HTTTATPRPTKGRPSRGTSSRVQSSTSSAPPGGSPDAYGKRAIVSRDDARDLSADRAALGAHLGDAGNPHHTTAAQVGALPANGGTVAGDLTVTGNVSLRGGSALFGTPNDTQTGFGNLQK